MIWCCLGWFLLGLFLGWFLNWLFDRFFRRGGTGTNQQSAGAASLDATAQKRAPNMTSSLAAKDTAAAAVHGFTRLKSPDGFDNFEIIEGIGPKINLVLHQAGVHTFGELASMEVSAISKILDAAGPNFKLANPQTWAEQSRLCDAGDWSALKALQDELVAGVALKRDDA